MLNFIHMCASFALAGGYNEFISDGPNGYVFFCTTTFPIKTCWVLVEKSSGGSPIIVGIVP